MKYTGPKAKRCRRQGMNLYGSDKYDRVLQKKPYGPGKGPKRRPGKGGRETEYARQLKEKQRARDIYGLSERQFHRLYREASAAKGQTGARFKQLLEQRLDNVLYRAGFASTRLQSRQFAGHGLFTVDGTRVTIPSYRLIPGQVVALRAHSKQSPVFDGIRATHDKYLPPGWLKVDPAQMTIEVLSLPKEESTEQAVDMRQVIEFYSRV